MENLEVLLLDILNGENTVCKCDSCFEPNSLIIKKSCKHCNRFKQIGGETGERIGFNIGSKFLKVVTEKVNKNNKNNKNFSFLIKLKTSIYKFSIYCNIFYYNFT